MSVNANTLLIRVEGLAYPKYLHDLKAEYSSSIFPSELDEVDVAVLGYEVVYTGTIPEGDVVTEGVPVKTNGKFYRTWEVRGFNEDEVAQRLEQSRSRVLEQLDQLFVKDAAEGMRYEHGVEVFHIQVREKDKSNLITLRYMADIAMANNVTSLMDFRSFENITHKLTPTQMSAMLGTAFFGGSALYSAMWALKDQAVAATSIAELPVVPSTLYN